MVLVFRLISAEGIYAPTLCSFWKSVADIHVKISHRFYHQSTSKYESEMYRSTCSATCYIFLLLFWWQIHYILTLNFIYINWLRTICSLFGFLPTLHSIKLKISLRLCKNKNKKLCSIIFIKKTISKTFSNNVF